MNGTTKKILAKLFGLIHLEITIYRIRVPVDVEANKKVLWGTRLKNNKTEDWRPLKNMILVF